MKSAGSLLLALAALLAAAAPATAGTYRIYACDAGGKVWDNRSWAVDGGVAAGTAADVACPTKGDPIQVRAGAGATTASGAQTILAFRSQPGTTIADFKLNRRLVYNNPAADGFHPFYSLYVLGTGTVFAGAGDHPASATLAPQKAWYGNPSDTRGIVSRTSFPALNGYKGDATVLSLRVGCHPRDTPCKVPAGGNIAHQLLGAEVTVNDPTAPTVTVGATGLLAGGQRDGSDPVAVTASDTSGIRRVEIIDVTDSATPRVVGFEEYDPDQGASTVTDAKSGCSWRLTKPCPNLSGETIRATSLETGRRRLLVRTIDAAANPTDQGPFEVDVVTPSDRGAPNGDGAGEVAVLTAGFTDTRTRRTVRQNARVRITGRLRTPAGAPVANAVLRILTRDLHRDTFVDRGTVTTRADGSFVYTARAYASRLIQFGWLARTRDTRFSANAYVTLRAKARATLSAPRSVRVGRTFSLTGKLLGLRPGRAPAIVAQGRTGRGRYAPFGTTKASSKGTFRLRYRFRSPASRGRTFTIRVLVVPRGRWPYEDGVSRTVRIRVR